MQVVHPDIQLPGAARRPTALELLAAGLLVATVILHVVAMVPQYYGGSGQGSLWSQPDQAALYAVLAAGWLLALGVAVIGPARAGVAAGLAVGLGVTEFGFRLSDLGQVFRYGSGQAGAGLWLMTAAWTVGTAGAVVAVLAVRRRRGATAVVPAPPPAPASAFVAAPDPTVTIPAGPADSADLTDAPDPTATITAGAAAAARTTEPPPYGAGPTILVAVLALVVAGAFLPAWDRYVGVSTTTGRSVSFTLGNAFSGPWQVVIGNVFAALALAVLPIAAIRLRDRAIGAAVIAGSLTVLASQFTAAVVQVDQVVPPSIAGLTPTQAQQLGLQLHMTLTGWFTLDVLAAFALFVVAMILGHARILDAPDQVSSAGTWPSTPAARREASLPRS